MRAHTSTHIAEPPQGLRICLYVSLCLSVYMLPVYAYLSTSPSICLSIYLSAGSMHVHFARAVAHFANFNQFLSVDLSCNWPYRHDNLSTYGHTLQHIISTKFSAWPAMQHFPLPRFADIWHIFQRLKRSKMLAALGLYIFQIDGHRLPKLLLCLGEALYVLV